MNVLITGSTDGIGLETAKQLIALGHHVIIHGRSEDKVAHVLQEVSHDTRAGSVDSAVADLSQFRNVRQLAADIKEKHGSLDVLINNAGIFSVNDATTADGLDVRFAVNTIAPYLLYQLLMPIISERGRVINLSSAAQASVDLAAMRGEKSLLDNAAYAQSKLALTMWSRLEGLSQQETGRVIVAVNPGSLLGSKMVKEAYGIAGDSLKKGADILCEAALSDKFSSAFGLYFDNDSAQFADPHPDAMNPVLSAQVVDEIKHLLTAH